MKITLTSNIPVPSMKRFGLITLLLAMPLAVPAQYAVFTDTFTSSTTNHLSVPGGTPSASFTSYDMASTKNTIGSTLIGPGRLRLSLTGATTGGFYEAQALFAASPVALNTIGDFITLTYTFTNTSGTLLQDSTGAYIFQGLYNSAGAPPVPGGLANQGLAGSAFPTGNAQNWSGYVARISSNGTSRVYTRLPQTGTTSINQALLLDGSAGGAFNNPPGTTIDVTEATPVTLNPNAPYTISYTIALTDVGTLTITNSLYDGVGTGGTLLFSLTNVATGANYLTNSFDGFAIGARASGSPSVNPTMDISSITITANIFGTPGPSFGVTGGGTGCPGTAFPIGLTGSVTTNDYRLFTNGVFNGVVQSGTGSAFNFPAEIVGSVALTNTVQASNTISAFTGFMSGQAIVAPFGAPVITTQPSPLLVATNGLGTFTVASSGSGLGYQWYKNGAKLTDGGHISGSGTATLVISPATTTDAATTAQGYYVIVTNDCGLEAISTTNSLTLDAPDNLTWQGGNPNDTWDVATTANFTNSTTLPVVFHAGDNVTFDDTSFVPIVSISGNYVAPTLITENASGNYFFTGPGTITGPAALLMNGIGTLTLSNANSYTGGTTISNGTVVERNGNFTSFGTGPVTLAGGALDIPIGGSSVVGFSNLINVATSGTLQYDVNGTFGCVISGPLTGNPNATLTINLNNPNTGTGRMRLYGAFTNNANIVLSSANAQVEIANYLASGNQVFNGVISGNYGRFVARGNGNAIFNNTNTFNDSLASVTSLQGYGVLLSSGNVGIGADSVSSVPPTIDASPVGTGILGINVGTEGGTCSLFASGGAHSIANKMVYTSASNTVTLILGGSNNLTFAGEFDLVNPGEATGTNRTLQVDNSAATTFSGLVTDNGVTGGGGITKTGNGTLYLNNADNYTGPTAVNAGVLAGSGSIASPVTVQTNGAIGGGTAASIGTLTVNNNLTLNGNVFVRVNKALSPTRSNDLVSVSGTLSNTGTGSITVTNLGPAIAAGDRFVLFNKAVASAGTMTVVGAGMNWTNQLATDGSIVALSVVSTVATNSTNITFSISGTNVTLSWPSDHLGWYLQMQTNGLRSTNWVDVAGSSSVTNMVIPVNPSIPTVFYRMSLQP